MKNASCAISIDALAKPGDCFGRIPERGPAVGRTDEGAPLAEIDAIAHPRKQVIQRNRPRSVDSMELRALRIDEDGRILANRHARSQRECETIARLLLQRLSGREIENGRAIGTPGQNLVSQGYDASRHT